MINHIELCGNLAKEPKKLTFPSGSYLFKCGIMVNKRDRNGKDLEKLFVPIEAWGGLGKSMYKNLEIGTRVYINGELWLDEWEDKETGDKRSRIVLKVRNYELINRKSSVNSGNDSSENTAPDFASNNSDNGDNDIPQEFSTDENSWG